MPLPPAKLEKVKRMLMAGKPIAEITGKWLRGKKREITVNTVQFYNARKADPELDMFVRAHIPRIRRLSGEQRWAVYRARKATAERREQANDYHAIATLVPANLPRDIRDDIVQSIFMALLEGSLRRDQVRGRIREFVASHNREANRHGVGKFGLVSLDAPIFADSSMTLKDTVQHGLW